MNKTALFSPQDYLQQFRDVANDFFRLCGLGGGSTTIDVDFERLILPYYELLATLRAMQGQLIFICHHRPFRYASTDDDLVLGRVNGAAFQNGLLLVNLLDSYPDEKVTLHDNENSKIQLFSYGEGRTTYKIYFAQGMRVQWDEQGYFILTFPPKSQSGENIYIHLDLVRELEQEEHNYRVLWLQKLLRETNPQHPLLEIYGPCFAKQEEHLQTKIAISPEEIVEARALADKCYRFYQMATRKEPNTLAVEGVTNHDLNVLLVKWAPEISQWRSRIGQAIQTLSNLVLHPQRSLLQDLQFIQAELSEVLEYLNRNR